MSCTAIAFAQPNYILPLAKPDKYRNKTLGSEKTDEKKFTIPRRLFQGMITHYNYYYNANNKIEGLVEKAKLAHQDEYTQLLPFYNYSTKITAGDSIELDSVIYKASAGIVLHDLRNSYIDNLYLLIGKSYFYWRKFDSAYRIFQFINYNFFPKGKDEFVTVVGANNRSTNGNLNIGTKEKNGLIHKAFSQPPSRNDALLWLAKTYAEDSLYTEALGLIKLLRKDALFPKRLHTLLDEVQAYVHYQNEQWDSTAFYLERALPNAVDKTELARWEYLLGQLYAKLNQPAIASKYYNKSKVHTTDPVLYIHARIYEAQLINSSTNGSVEQTLNDLMKLAKKERFDGYEDVLYYAAGSMALQKPDSALAKELLLKSVSVHDPQALQNTSLRNKAWLMLADVAYGQKDYVFASNCYDSLIFSDPSLTANALQLQMHQQILKELVTQIQVVRKEDSLQRIAAMPEKEMEDYLKSLAKKLRKQRGLKEDPDFVNPAVLINNQNQPVDLFTSTGGGWYFSNTAQKSKGFNEFKAKWGNRPNLDNWRRKAAIDAALVQNNIAQASGGISTDPSLIPEEDLSVDGLKKNLPLTEEQKLESNKKIADALFQQGQIYKNQLEDYNQAARVFEELWKRYNNYEQEQQTLFELYYCNQKAGNNEKATYFLNLLNQKYPKGEYVQKVNHAKNPKPAGKDEKTLAYEHIYNTFLSGSFDDALRQKKIADSLYGKTYWTPQLLYIESLYHINKKDDSTAIATLGNIQANFPGTPMAEKAEIMIDVLKRRKEIEDYLTNTNIVRESESVYIPFDDGPQVNKIKQQEIKKDTLGIVISNKPLQTTNLEKPIVPVQKVGVEKENKNHAEKITINKKPAANTTRIKPLKEVKIETSYIYSSDEPYVVLMYFNAVDPIYISESKIAFTRYNNTSHSGEGLTIQIYEGGADNNWLELGVFADVTGILGYMDELKQNAKQIVPWLPADKYHFLVISQRNLEMLKTRKNIEEYKLFIRQYIKDKF